MLHTIENDYLRVSVDDHGAELCSIFDKIHNREVIWQADPAYWKRHAPVLFPNVGRHFEDHYRINGTEYPSKQHGFARDSEFTCVDMTADSITHKLKSSDATKENYPYDFELKIKHVLKKNQVSVCWEVVNHSNETMYFTIGGHPAFNVPAQGNNDKKEDYLLTFNGEKSLTYLLLDPASGTALPDQTKTLELTDGTCHIDAHMFDNDALVFDNQIEKAGIAFPDGTPYLELTCHRFPNFGIWSVPGSSFVCLEPWMGRCDDCGFKGDLAEKANINALNVDEIFNASYEIKIY